MKVEEEMTGAFAMKKGYPLHGAFLLQFVFVGFFASGSSVLGGYMVQRLEAGLSLAHNQLDAEPSVVTKVLSSYVARDGISIYTIQSNGFVAKNYLGGWSDPVMQLPIGNAWFLEPVMDLIEKMSVLKPLKNSFERGMLKEV